MNRIAAKIVSRLQTIFITADGTHVPSIGSIKCRGKEMVDVCTAVDIYAYLFGLCFGKIWFVRFDNDGHVIAIPLSDEVSVPKVHSAFRCFALKRKPVKVGEDG